MSLDRLLARSRQRLQLAVRIATIARARVESVVVHAVHVHALASELHCALRLERADGCAVAAGFGVSARVCLVQEDSALRCARCPAMAVASARVERVAGW